MNVNLIDAVVVIAAIAVTAVVVALYVYGRRSERLKYEFITIIAHKFRTPLTQVKWLVEGLLKDETDPYKKQSLSEISLSNESLIKLTGTLIELTDAAGSADSAYKLERLDLCGFVRSAVEAQRQAFHEKNIFVTVGCDPEAVFVKADKARLGFVLDVLLSNARAYTSPGHNVSIGVTATWRKVFIAVKDDGIGMGEADMKRLFQKFFRSDKAKAMDTEGFGVGLYLARSVVLRHGGKLIPYSEGLGKGSTFSVQLRRAR